MTESDRRAEQVRAFNRFYTGQIGLLRQKYLNSPFSLTELRILYELAHRDHWTAADLCRTLDLDPGYVSRCLKNFERRGYVRRKRTQEDARSRVVTLTKRGRGAFIVYDTKARGESAAMLAKLPEESQTRLLAAMRQIETLLGGKTATKPIVLRPPQPGDVGWVIYRHGAFYAREYGWDERFEAIVAEIGAKFLHNFDPKRERCWIAERDGEMVGSIFLAKHSGTVAKLRLLLVEPSARGSGIGGKLVDECIRFARNAGYKKVTLWTQNNLHAARRIYQRAGFQLVHEEPNHEFGKKLLSQTWDLTL